MGMRLTSAKDFSAAKKEFEGVLQADPGFSLAVFQIANCQYNLGDRTTALKTYERYLSMDPAASPRVKQFVESLRRSVGSAGTASHDGGLVKWMSEAAAKAEAQRTGKPILYSFTAAWCKYCKAQNKEVFSVARHSEWINKEYLPVRIVDEKREKGANAVAVAELEKKYEVEGFPTLVVYSPQVDTWKGFSGYGDANGTLYNLELSLKFIRAGKKLPPG